MPPCNPSEAPTDGHRPRRPDAPAAPRIASPAEDSARSARPQSRSSRTAEPNTGIAVSEAADPRGTVVRRRRRRVTRRLSSPASPEGVHAYTATATDDAADAPACRPDRPPRAPSTFTPPPRRRPRAADAFAFSLRAEAGAALVSLDGPRRLSARSARALSPSSNCGRGTPLVVRATDAAGNASTTERRSRSPHMLPAPSATPVATPRPIRRSARRPRIARPSCCARQAGRDADQAARARPRSRRSCAHAAVPLGTAVDASSGRDRPSPRRRRDRAPSPRSSPADLHRAATGARNRSTLSATFPLRRARRLSATAPGRSGSWAASTPPQGAAPNGRSRTRAGRPGSARPARRRGARQPPSQDPALEPAGLSKTARPKRQVDPIAHLTGVWEGRRRIRVRRSPPSQPSRACWSRHAPLAAAESTTSTDGGQPHDRLYTITRCRPPAVRRGENAPCGGGHDQRPGEE